MSKWLRWTLVPVSLVGLATCSVKLTIYEGLPVDAPPIEDASMVEDAFPIEDTLQLSDALVPPDAPPDVVIDGPVIDALPPMPDAPMTVPDARTCFGAIPLCLDASPTGDRTIESFDTGVDADCTQLISQPGGPQLCVVAAQQVTVSGTATVVGTRPLVLVASDALTVSDPGTLDVSSNRDRTGAGANTGTCTTAGRGGSSDDGGGGGAGGSFGTTGGNGGVSDGAGTDASGGLAGAVQPIPTILRGGCPGGAGGAGRANTAGGLGGHGGGAVYLIAGRRITIDGDVFASGAGGKADATRAGIDQGGGGGGAGGMIILDAPEIQFGTSARVAANGGAGGGGGDHRDGGGLAGGDGTTINWDAPATAGTGRVGFGNGGNGAQGTAINATSNTNGQAADGGGGGGAGGLGHVLTFGTLVDAVQISPAPTSR